MTPRPVVTDPKLVLDVFQPGLTRGAERLPYDPSKQYFYVEHPVDGWRVYLRAACFIHEQFKPFDPTRFLVVKRTGAAADGPSWEAPKGQMEGRDAVTSKKSIHSLLRTTIRREVEEEAKLPVLRDLQHTGLILQSVEPDFPPNTYFQYHIYSATAHPRVIEQAFEEFAWFEAHPAAFQRLKRDKREKDALAWFDAVDTRLMGKWSPTLVKTYLSAFSRS